MPTKTPQEILKEGLKEADVMNISIPGMGVLGKKIALDHLTTLGNKLIEAEKERIRQIIRGARLQRFYAKEMHGLHLGEAGKEGFIHGWQKALSIIRNSLNQK